MYSIIRETDRVTGWETFTAILLLFALQQGRESMPYATQFTKLPDLCWIFVLVSSCTLVPGICMQGKRLDIQSAHDPSEQNHSYWYWKNEHKWINDLCNTIAQAEHKLTLQIIQKSFSKFYSSNKECAVIPDTNTVWCVVIVWIKVYTVVKYELLTFTVAYVAHTVYKDGRLSLDVYHRYRHDWVHIEKPTPSTALVWHAWKVWRSLP